MNTNFQFQVPCLIGDTILPEPALAALGEHLGQKVSLSGVLPELRFLYENHPWIELTDEPGFQFESWEAMKLAASKRCKFTHAFFDQVGLEYSGQRDHYQKFPKRTYNRGNYICIVPWARSCQGLSGGFANLMEHDFNWWSRIAKACGHAVFSVGAPYVPAIENTQNIRRMTLQSAVEFLAGARVVVTVKTGLAHVMEGYRTCNTILLSPRDDAWFVSLKGQTLIEAYQEKPMKWDENKVIELIHKMMESPMPV